MWNWKHATMQNNMKTSHFSMADNSRNFTENAVSLIV